jgi:hypothetical protein
MVFMTHYTIQSKSTREPSKSKAELREMLAEAIRNTAKPPEPTRPPKPKTNAA